MSGEFKTIRNGAIVTGTIIEITPTGVYVDLGYKSDGVISSEEFEGSTKDLKVGEKIRVYVKRVDDGNGQLT
ncbi:MAG TPA: S1 RNA-binding domain-containing protein, partial [Candidatus Ozemobacteraceae bacterium]|nr:S1 RNA-binding domain-containing protein [Candidatus Ozemobacteraceae bacterium]